MAKRSSDSHGLGGLARSVLTTLRSRRDHRRPATADPTAIVVDYRPETDGGADPGEVVWTWVPYEEDPSRGKDRPVLVVGAVGDRLAAVMLTSKWHPERTEQIEVGTGAWDREGRTSYAKLDRIVAVRPDRIRREGAQLDRQRFDRVVAALSDRPGWPHLRVEPV